MHSVDPREGGNAFFLSRESSETDIGWQYDVGTLGNPLSRDNLGRAKI